MIKLEDFLSNGCKAGSIGAGLGLYLAREYIKLLGTFYISLPVNGHQGKAG